MNDVIKRFKGRYYFLSNFYPSMVSFDGYTYLNSEAAFQAQKCANPDMRAIFCSLNPSDAKRIGRHVDLRSDWEKVKFDLMEGIVRAKFTQNERLRDELINTGGAILIEGNTWGDKIWGVDLSNGVGENHLGKILMKVRKELRLARKEEEWKFSTS